HRPARDLAPCLRHPGSTTRARAHRPGAGRRPQLPMRSIEQALASHEELRDVLAWVLDSTRRSYVTLLANNMKNAGGITHERVPWYVQLRRDDPGRPDEPDMGNDPWILYTDPPQDADRLFALLKATGLGSEPTLGVMGAAVLVELRAVAVRMARGGQHGDERRPDPTVSPLWLLREVDPAGGVHLALRGRRG